MVGTLQPLDKKFAIVDRFGNPTDYFVRWAQQKQIDITGSIALSDLIAYLDAHQLIAGVGIQFSPGPNGDINQSPTIHADVQAILDEISATRGIIIYRGLLGWAALLPGTAGNVLQTNGAGADPTWVAPSGGGGITVYFAQNNTSGSTGTTPTVQTAVITANIPASGVARTFMVNGNITWRDGGHSMRGGVLLDTTQVWPNVVGSNQGVDCVTDSDGLNHLVYAGILVTVPGDNAAHTISLSWESSGSTAAITIENRQIVAVQIV